jgi:hypothetical protein
MNEPDLRGRSSVRTVLLNLLPLAAWSVGCWLVGAGKATWVNIPACLVVVILMSWVVKASAAHDLKLAYEAALELIRVERLKQLRDGEGGKE